jgi:hypothetical protein
MARRFPNLRHPTLASLHAANNECRNASQNGRFDHSYLAIFLDGKSPSAYSLEV